MAHTVAILFLRRSAGGWQGIAFSENPTQIASRCTKTKLEAESCSEEKQHLPHASSFLIPSTRTKKSIPQTSSDPSGEVFHTKNKQEDSGWRSVPTKYQNTTEQRCRPSFRGVARGRSSGRQDSRGGLEPVPRVIPNKANDVDDITFSAQVVAFFLAVLFIYFP